MRLLFLTPQFPVPPTQGAAIRNSHLIAGLAARHEVTLITFAPPGDLTPPPPSLAGKGESLAPLPQGEGPGVRSPGRGSDSPLSQGEGAGERSPGRR